MMKKLFLSLTLIGILFPSFSFAAFGPDFIASALGITAVCSSALSSPNDCAESNDQNYTTRWAAASSGVASMPQFIKFDLTTGTTKTAAQMTIWSYSDVNGQGIKEWQLWGSNNNFVSTTTVATGTQPNIADGASSTYNFSNATGYRYYELNISSTYSSGANIRASIYDVELYEQLAATPAKKMSISWIIGE